MTKVVQTTKSFEQKLLKRVDTTGTVWLGLSLACAKCHTHKYDPVTIDEYYQLYSFFNQSEDNDHNDDRPLQRFPTDWQKKKLAEISKSLKHLTEQREKKFKTATIQESYSKWREQEKDKWNHGTITSLHTTSGVQLIQNKNRITAEKHADSEDTYKIDLRLPAKSYKALKLATFPLEHLPSKGSSFDKEGLYLLSYLQIKKNGKVIKLKKHHSYLQENRSNPQKILSAHESKISGWALKRFNANKKNLLVIEFEDKLKVSKDDQITVELVHNSNFHKKKIASFEIAFSQGQDSPKKTLEKFTKNPKQLFFDESKEFKGLSQKIAKLEKDKKQNLGSLTPIMKDLPTAKHRKNFIHESGFFLNVGKGVSPATPEFLHSMKKDWPKNRLGFAKWLISKENPLTAKVAANRIWAQIFGRGIVETEEDFGNQGLMPSHPELIDWLAMEYMNNGWSQKKLLKTIFLSDTYQQSSKVTAETLQKDRFNIYLARGPRFRMTAEMIRDSSLKAAGLLSSKMYGNSVMPYQPPGLWMSTYNSMKWQTSKGEDKYRRGIYTYLKRTSPYPTMTAFDAPSRELCTARRIRSNTPLQSLITMNDPVFVEAAQGFARRVILSSKNDTNRIQFAYQTALGRKADATEVQAISSLYKERLEYYKTFPEEATNMAEKPLGKVPANIQKPQAAAWTAACNVILNLDEFLTKE
ncbi:MAG: DUF1549 and DUF1553 domain-containing protein [Lentisphaerales bacterium]|nr:DUF1549 and DUF1553 domain-containing protein [Lentisphaerales bacterium]